MTPPKILKPTISLDTFSGRGPSLGVPPQLTAVSNPNNPFNDSNISWLDTQRAFEQLASLRDELHDGYLRSIVFWGPPMMPLSGGEENIREGVEKALRVSSLRHRTDLAVVHLDELSELISKTDLLSSLPAEIEKLAEVNLLRAKQLVVLLRLNGFRVITEEAFENKKKPPV